MGNNDLVGIQRLLGRRHAGVSRGTKRFVSRPVNGLSGLREQENPLKGVTRAHKNTKALRAVFFKNQILVQLKRKAPHPFVHKQFDSVLSKIPQ